MPTENPAKPFSRPFYAKWSNVPFAPARSPFFYGWIIVAVSTVSIICSIPGQTAGVGVFTDHIINALGLTRSELSLAYMIGTLTSGFLLPYAGRVLDVIGVRLMSIIASLGLAVSLLVMSGVDIFAALLERLLPSEVTAIIAASVAFLLIRFFGQGNMTTVGRVAMGRWFNRHRGMATAISGIPITFAFNSAPWFLSAAIVALGWRQACWLMAVAIGAGMGTLGLLFLRDTPEECGLTMDGTPNTEQAQRKHPDLHPIYRDFTRREAVRTLPFWTIALLLSLHGMVITAFAFHITSFGEEMGKTASEATRIFLYFSFFTLPIRFLTAYIMDRTRIPLAWVLVVLSLAVAGSQCGLLFLDTPLGYVTTLVMFGLCGGIWGVLADASLPRFFGRKHLGAISSAVMSAMVMTSAVGPFLFSFGKSILGSYRAVILWMLLFPGILLVMSLFTRNPQHRYAPNTASPHSTD